MKTLFKANLVVLLFVAITNAASAQQIIKIVSGDLQIADGSMVFRPARYSGKIDSLAKVIKTNARDTSSLFFHSVLLYKSNDLLAKPSPDAPGTMSQLQTALAEAKQARDSGMIDFRLKVLCAHILKALAYQYSGDQSWKFNASQIQMRRKKFAELKEQANTAFDDLGKLDSNNAYDYQKQKINYDYPIK